MNYDYKLYLEIRKIYFMSEIYEHVRTSETDNKIVLLLKFHYTKCNLFSRTELWQWTNRNTQFPF